MIWQQAFLITGSDSILTTAMEISLTIKLLSAKMRPQNL